MCRHPRLPFRDGADVQALITWLNIQRRDNYVTLESTDRGGKNIENMAVKDLLKPAHPISVQGTTKDKLINEFISGQRDANG